MKTTITTIIVGLFLLSCVSAVGSVELMAGEPYTFNLPEPPSYYIVSGNTTEIILDVAIDSNVVTIIPSKYLNDNFTLTFYNEEGKAITSSGGGGGGGYFVYPNDKKVVKNETISNQTELPELIQAEDTEEINDPYDIKDSNRRGLIIIGIIFVVIMVTLIYFIFFRGR